MEDVVSCSINDLLNFVLGTVCLLNIVINEDRLYPGAASALPPSLPNAASGFPEAAAAIEAASEAALSLFRSLCYRQPTILPMSHLLPLSWPQGGSARGRGKQRQMGSE